MITNRIPGGNIQVVSVEGRNIELDVEMRDSAGDWFYWCFKAVFPEKGTYRFHFVRSDKVGTRGPALSLDGGRSWRWLCRERWNDGSSFRYECPEAGQEVIFCMGIFSATGRHFSGSLKGILFFSPARSAGVGRGGMWSL